MKYTTTTVKLEAPVVQEIAEVLEPGQTLTAFVREAVTYRARKARLRKAALAYRQVLSHDAAGAGEMAEWEQAHLAADPKRKQSDR
jgi:hypothetical protein